MFASVPPPHPTTHAHTHTHTHTFYLTHIYHTTSLPTCLLPTCLVAVRSFSLLLPYSYQEPSQPRCDSQVLRRVCVEAGSWTTSASSRSSVTLSGQEWQRRTRGWTSCTSGRRSDASSRARCVGFCLCMFVCMLSLVHFCAQIRCSIMGSVRRMYKSSAIRGYKGTFTSIILFQQPDLSSSGTCS